MTLKDELLRLLEEDRSFRLAVAGLLGYDEILRRLEEHDKKFSELLSELREHRKILEEHRKILEEYDKRFYEILSELKKHREILEKHQEALGRHEEILEGHSRKFNDILLEIARLRESFDRLSKRVEVTIGSMGRRWGFDLEKMLLETFKEVLERKGIEPGKVEKFRFKDVDGSYTGVRGKIIDVDVLVKDEGIYLIEVKSRAELEHVESLQDKAKVIERIFKKPVAKMLVVAVNIDREAYERAKELNMEVIYGNILE